jgi:hypothetical protein
MLTLQIVRVGPKKIKIIKLKGDCGAQNTHIMDEIISEHPVI